MTREDLIKNNPLRVLNPEGQAAAGPHMGLVIARAGLGKTAILVQIALDSILRGQKVLHISIGEGLDKAKAWYTDIVRLLAEERRLENPAAVEEAIMGHRMIMTFKVSGFSRPKLEERLKDLMEQSIFVPDCIVVDGFDFSGTGLEAMQDLREFLSGMNVRVWFSSLCHREDTRVSEAGVPAPCHELEDLFETVIVLKAEPDAIRLHILKNGDQGGAVGATLSLDPATMLIKEA
jgi:hypothetical protein